MILIWFAFLSIPENILAATEALESETDALRNMFSWGEQVLLHLVLMIYALCASACEALWL